MISYDLAKKLKDAGFPQNGWMRCPCGFSDADFPKCKHVPAEYVFAPTLPELIEACKKPIQIIVMPNGATAMDFSGDGIACTGKTPEEAVANLWIALNKK